MALLVQKFGGTSVGDIDRINAVAERVAGFIRGGHQVLVVVSAMAGETDRLEALGQSVAKQQDPREMDVLLSAGEQALHRVGGHGADDARMQGRGPGSGAQVRIRTRCEPHEGPHRGD